MTLTEFLLARIAEDETRARAWSRAHNDPGPQPTYHYEIMRRHRREWPTLWRSLDRFTPERALAECEARRRIVHEHAWTGVAWAAANERDCPRCGMDQPCSTLRILAEVYADHPDFREEWAP